MSTITTLKENFDIIYRNLSKAYQNADMEKRIKLTEDTERKIRAKAKSDFQMLHDKKWKYKEDIDKLNKEMEDIKTTLNENNLDIIEEDKLKIEFLTKRLEKNQKINIIPQIEQKMFKTVSNAKEQVKIVKSKPIRIVDKVVRRWPRFMLKVTAFFLTISKTSSFRKLDSENVSDVSQFESATLKVGKTDSENIGERINTAFKQAESNSSKDQNSTEIITGSDVAELVSQVLDSEEKTDKGDSTVAANNPIIIDVDPSELRSVDSDSTDDSYVNGREITTEFRGNENPFLSDETFYSSEVDSGGDRLQDNEVVSDNSQYDSENSLWDNSSILAAEDKLNNIKSTVGEENSVEDLAKICEQMLGMVNSSEVILNQKKDKYDECVNLEKETINAKKVKTDQLKQDYLEKINSLYKVASTNFDRASTLTEQTAAKLSSINNIRSEIETLDSMKDKLNSGRMDLSDNSSLSSMLNESANKHSESSMYDSYNSGHSYRK